MVPFTSHILISSEEQVALVNKHKSTGTLKNLKTANRQKVVRNIKGKLHKGNKIISLVYVGKMQISSFKIYSALS